MIRTFFLVIVALTLRMGVADPRNIEGFRYLGDVPTATRSGSPRASYYISTSSETWPSAYQTCNSFGGRLATPLNPVEDNALRTFMNTASGAIVWIGGRAIGSVYKWETVNLPVTWSNFHKDNHCQLQSNCLTASHVGPTWGWCGYSCNNYLNYVCEF